MRIEDEVKLDFRDVLIRPKRSTLSSRKEVDLQRTYKFKHSGLEYTGIPIMASNMDGVGTFDMARALYEHRMFTCFVKSYSLDDFIQNCSDDFYYGNYVAVSTGTNDSDWSKLQQILSTYPELHFICIDIANGYSEHFGDFVSKVRERYPTHTIIAGNVVTADMTQELILRGADIIKVGIGPGSVCTTRIQTGVGYPQLSAIIECADAAHGLGAHIIADGGCVCPGDVAKAFGAGADFVMLGGMLAGHDEGGGEVKDGKITFYGMSSDTAMNKHSGGVADYRSSEGRTVEIIYKGSVQDTVLDLLGGLRSTCTYVGASSLKQLSKCTTFIRVNRQINDVFLK
jgi:GMP reductase